MDLGGQVYHEKLMHSFILMESEAKIGAIFTNFWCGQMDGNSFAIILEQAYRQHYLTKPCVVCIKGRGTEEGNNVIRNLQKDFP